MLFCNSILNKAKLPSPFLLNVMSGYRLSLISDLTSP